MKEKNIKTASENEANHMELGKFYFLNNKYDEAVIEFKKVLEYNPGNAQAYYNIGLINEACNKIEEAKEIVNYIKENNLSDVFIITPFRNQEYVFTD